MLYTITFNPAVDLVMKTDEVFLGELNRVQKDEYVAGGKGINMSVLLKRLGHDNIATGFIGGFTGTFVRESLENEGVQTAFLELAGTTRINVKLHAKEETELNANGPIVTESDVSNLLAYFDKVLVSGDVVFLAGNAAPGMTSEDYVKVARLCQEKDALFVLDSNKALLTACLPQGPFLIKPNAQELSEIFETSVETLDDVVVNARKLQELGAQNVIVSLGGDGAVLVTKDQEIYQSSVPQGRLVNSVGAGDSMVAGFMAKYIETKDYAQSLRQGAACGSATAFSVGIAEAELAMSLVDEIQIKRIGEES